MPRTSKDTENPRNYLRHLIHQRKNENLKYIIRKIPSQKLHNSTAITLLHLAAKYNNYDLIEYLTKIGCNVDAKDESGRTPLMSALLYNRLKPVKVCLNVNANIWSTDYEGRSVLQILLNKENNVSSLIFEILIKKFQDSIGDAEKFANILFEANCPLERVLLLHDTDLLKKILKLNDTIDNEQQYSTLLICAIKTADVENVRVILHHEPGKTERRNLFLKVLLKELCASRFTGYGHIRSCLTLLTDWDVADKKIEQIAILIFKFGVTEDIQELLRCFGDGLDQLIVYSFTNRKIDAIKLVLGRNFDVNICDEDGLTALHHSLHNNSERYVRFLLDKGADTATEDKHSRTPLDCTQYHEKYSCIFLQHGATICINTTKIHKGSSKDYLNTLAYVSCIESHGQGIYDEIFEKFNQMRLWYRCCEDILWMKNMGIKENVTLYEILTEKVEYIIQYVKDREAVKVILNLCHENRVQPYYYSILKASLNRAVRFYDYKEEVARIVAMGMKVYMTDHLAVVAIMSYVRYRDLIGFEYC